MSAYTLNQLNTAHANAVLRMENLRIECRREIYAACNEDHRKIYDLYDEKAMPLDRVFDNLEDQYAIHAHGTAR